jgi:methyl-accepting chemotaxis protein
MFVGCCRARGFVISLLAGQAYPAIYKGSELVETISAKSGDYGAVADEFVSVLSRSIDLSSEQATKFEQINKAIGEISHIVQANSACAEEAAAAAEEMTAQSEGMKQCVAQPAALVGSKNKDAGVLKVRFEYEEGTARADSGGSSAGAARAGEAGTGFAVVSDEVRALGARSTEAAKNTIALIDEAMSVINRGNELITMGIRKFVDYGETSASISPFTLEAAKVAENQAGGVERINRSVEEIGKAAQNNAAGSEESASVAEETTAQAEFMTKIVRELADLVV